MVHTSLGLEREQREHAGHGSTGDGRPARPRPGAGFYFDPALGRRADQGRPYWPGARTRARWPSLPMPTAQGCVHLRDVWNRLDLSSLPGAGAAVRRRVRVAGPAHMVDAAGRDHRRPAPPESPGMVLHQKADDGNGKLTGASPTTSPRPPTSTTGCGPLSSARPAPSATASSTASTRGPAWARSGGSSTTPGPVTSWALVDSGGRPKPAWYSARRLMRPAAARPSNRGAHAGGFAVNDTADPWPVGGAARRLDVDGRVLAEVAGSTCPSSRRGRGETVVPPALGHTRVAAPRGSCSPRRGAPGRGGGSSPTATSRIEEAPPSTSNRSRGRFPQLVSESDEKVSPGVNSWRKATPGSPWSSTGLVP